jgi:hypothetical protein
MSINRRKGIRNIKKGKISLKIDGVICWWRLVSGLCPVNSDERIIRGFSKFRSGSTTNTHPIQLQDEYRVCKSGLHLRTFFVFFPVTSLYLHCCRGEGWRKIFAMATTFVFFCRVGMVYGSLEWSLRLVDQFFFFFFFFVPSASNCKSWFLTVLLVTHCVYRDVEK